MTQQPYGPDFTRPGYSQPYQPPAGQGITRAVTIEPGVPHSSRRGRGGIGALLAVALISGGVGGAAALGINEAVRPAASVQDATATRTVTKVVQGDASAPDWSVTASKVTPSVVAITVTDGRNGGQGSGVILDAAGHVVTNNHVVAGIANAAISVAIGDQTYEAAIVGTDPTTDLAVIKLASPPKDLTPISFADSTTVKVGDPVMAIGNPLGLSGTVTTGIVSALNRPVTTTAESSDGGGQSGQPELVVTNAIQTSAAINPGNSGGALVNANGELIGINSSIATLSSGRQTPSGSIGIGFAIGSAQVKYVTDQLISSGRAQHAFMGISAQNATVAAGGHALVGAKIKTVSSGGPAEAAGLKVGDLITSIAGVPVQSSESLVALVRSHKVGETVDVSVWRDGAQQKVSLRLAANPNQGR